MTPEDLLKMTKEELLKLARKKNIPNRSRMTKAGLIEKIHLLMLEEEEKKMTEPTSKERPAPYYGPTTVLTTEKKETDEEVLEIPFSYNQTLVTLMVRDPYWLYSYWDFSGKTVNELSQVFGGWERVPLCLRVYNLSADGEKRSSYFDISLNHQVKNWYINVNQPNCNFQVDLGYFTPSGHFQTLARSNIVTTPRDTISDVVDEEWMVVEEDYRRLYRLAVGAGIGQSSLEMTESLLKRLEREVGSGAVSSISSPVRLLEEKRHFWLVLDTELIIYGATEPDATLTIQGQPVKLRPDGSFTLRMALPEGTQIIPVTATSRDGKDQITITPLVSKETR
ncbi:MAG TPA: DUF4912 domain-containing protein [Firmicutes bacterium]|nr:DUF4912 domain-containing protein [Bacillota bacterium]